MVWTQYITNYLLVVRAHWILGGRECLLVIFSRFARSLFNTPKVGFYFANMLPAGKKYEYEMQQSVLLGNINLQFILRESEKRYYATGVAVIPDKNFILWLLICCTAISRH